MLQGTGEQTIGLDHQHRAIELRQRCFDLDRATHFGTDAANAEAALKAGFLFLAIFKLWIDEDQWHDRLQFRLLTIDLEIGNAFGIKGTIDDREADILADLRGGKSHAIGIGHRFEHVGHKDAQRVIDFGDGAAALAEDGVTVLDDFADHGVIRMRDRLTPKIKRSNARIGGFCGR